MYNFLYILAWKTGEDYADITYLSMSFLKEVHPDAQILLLTDPETAKALREVSHPLMSLTDRMIASEVPCTSTAMKSWYLKSRMRRLIEGDFLFLDADTIVRERLDDLFLTEAPIYLADNHSLNYPENFPDIEKAVYEQNNWPLPGNGHFFNSGVILWKDNLEAHQLGRLWEKLWDLSASNGFGFDQPALNRAIEQSGIPFQILDKRFNAQIRANPLSGIDASIWHFYRTDRRWFPDDWFSMGLRMIQQGEGISGKWIREVCKARIPWPSQDIAATERVIEYLTNGGKLTCSAYEHLTGMVQPSTSNATVCTIITASYLPYAKALLESVRAYEPDIHFNIFISDIEKHKFTGDVNDRHVFCHFSDEVCKPGVGQKILDKYQWSDHDAFRWSCKPIFINHLIREKGYDRVLYFDCDIYIFNAFRFLFDALRTHKVLLTPHWRSKEPETDPEEYRFLFNHGLYNAGFIGVNAEGTEAMDWWARCCLHSCARGSFEGEFVDQSILNLMPVYFEGIHVLRHKGCNVAIWNRHECRRVMQYDGSIKIDDLFPVVFIHFSAGIPRSWDPLLGSYMDRYLAALKQFDAQIWERELERRNPARDTYIEQKSGIYLRIKQQVVSARFRWLPYPTDGNVAILAQSGTSQQCLGLWLRQVQGTLLTSKPVIQWSGHGIDTLDEKISWHQSIKGTTLALESMLGTAMAGRLGDPIHVNWAHWSALLRIKRMVMNFPEGALCWPELAEIIGQHHNVIALVSHPAPFAKRMMAIYGDGRHLHCMADTRKYLIENTKRPTGLEDIPIAEFAWMIKWCLDMQRLEAAASSGKRILFVHEEDLMCNTRQAIYCLLQALKWPWADDIAAHFHKFCVFREQESAENTEASQAPAYEEKLLAIDQLTKSFGINARRHSSDLKNPRTPIRQLRETLNMS